MELGLYVRNITCKAFYLAALIQGPRQSMEQGACVANNACRAVHLADRIHRAWFMYYYYSMICNLPILKHHAARQSRNYILRVHFHKIEKLHF